MQILSLSRVMSKCRRLSGSYSFTKGTLRLSSVCVWVGTHSCSEMQSPVDAGFSVDVITCCRPHSKASARGCKLKRIRRGHHKDVAITRILPARPLMNWVHPWVCRPPPEVLINTAHIGRSVLGKRPDLYHKVPSNPASSRCRRFSVRCRLQ